MKSASVSGIRTRIIATLCVSSPRLLTAGVPWVFRGIPAIDTLSGKNGAVKEVFYILLRIFTFR